MPWCGEHTYATTHPIATGTTAPLPNSSTPMIVIASGVFAAPANTATNPTAASIDGSRWSTDARVAPHVAPITVNGVTSPPGKPEPSVTAVNTSLSANANVATPT